MAKRSTIGENPLDAVNQEHPLNTVVPDLSAVTRGGRGQPAPEVSPEVQERLQELEAGLKALRTEVAGLKASAGEAAAVKGTIAPLPGRTGRTAPGGRGAQGRGRGRQGSPGRSDAVQS